MKTTITLPTAGLSATETQIAFEGAPDGIRAQNFELLREKWPTVWPLIFAAFKEVLDEYEHTDVLTSHAPKLSIHLSESRRMNDRSGWLVILEFEPFGGIYDVTMRGWTKVVSSSVGF